MRAVLSQLSKTLISVNNLEQKWQLADMESERKVTGRLDCAGGLLPEVRWCWREVLRIEGFVFHDPPLPNTLDNVAVGIPKLTLAMPKPNPYLTSCH